MRFKKKVFEKNCIRGLWSTKGNHQIQTLKNYIDGDFFTNVTHKLQIQWYYITGVASE